MDVHFSFKIKIENKNFEHRFIKEQWQYPDPDQESKFQSETSSIVQSPKSGLRGQWCSLCLQNQDRKPKYRTQVNQHQWPFLHQDHDPKPQSGTATVIQSLQSRLQGHGCSLHLQNQDRVQRLGSWVYQRHTTISKWRSRSKSPVRNLQGPLKTKIRT